MDIQNILINNMDNLDPNIINQLGSTPSTETMDLEAIAKKAYDDEMAKHQAEIAAAQAQYEDAKAALEQAQAASAQLSSGNIESIVPYDDNTLALLQQQALSQLLAQQQQTPQDLTNINELVQNYNTVEPLPITSADISNYTSGNTVGGGFVMPVGMEKETVYKIIAAEGGNISPGEAVNIASTMINRARAGNWGGGNDIYKLATARDQYVVYQNGTYQTAALTPESRAAVDQLFASASAGGATAHQYQSFRSKTSSSGTQLVSGGNKYR